MHLRHRVPPGVGDGVIGGHRLSALEYQLHTGYHALPAVEYVKPLEGTGVNALQLQWLAQHPLLSADHDKSGGASVQPAPPQSLVDPLPERRHALNAIQFLQVLRPHRSGGSEPLLCHVVRDDAHHVLYYPVVPVEGVEQGVVVRHPGQRILCGLQRRLGAIAQPEQRVGKCVLYAHRLGIWLCAPGAAFIASGHLLEPPVRQ